uniref:Uncharacterized protein n=2 Tax=Oryzias melastigma TaxID=30732 RepID=A0A3B3C0S8_ORYME
MKHLKFLSSQQSVTMTTKRGLITDSFKVVKKKKRGGKQEKSPTPPPPQTEEVADPVQQEALQKLRDFDLNWRFGPCTGVGANASNEMTESFKGGQA